MEPVPPPPDILPVSGDRPRPRWSVMIPAYNCADTLRLTLESVLSQDPGEDLMQVEVLDNASADDPESVVRAVAADRVAYHRHPTNIGPIANFNECVARSRGHLVHILHGDDYVLPGFYRAVEDLADRHPEAALIATRSYYVDEAGRITGATPVLRDFASASRELRSFYYSCPIQCPAVVLRREFYERHGGWRLLVPSDYELWIRAVARAGGVVSPEILACYRKAEGNQTSGYMRTGANVRDLKRCAHLLEGVWPDRQVRLLLERTAATALRQAAQFRERGEPAAAAANLAAFREVATLTMIARRLARRVRESWRELRWKALPW